MIGLPLFWDQYDNAQRIAEAGVGTRLSTYECAADELLGTIDRLLADTAVRDRTAAVGRRLRADSGRDRAATLIEQLAASPD